MRNLRTIWTKLCKLAADVANLEGQNHSHVSVDYPSVFACGLNTSDASQLNCEITQTALGRHSVLFGSPHPLGDTYAVTLGVLESGTLRDVPKASVVEGSMTSAGFNVQITVDDNGGAADGYSNDAFSFATYALRSHLTET